MLKQKYSCHLKKYHEAHPQIKLKRKRISIKKFIRNYAEPLGKPFASKLGNINLPGDIFLSKDSSQTGINNKVMCIGDERQWKNLVLSNVLKMQGSYVITDPDGSIFQKTHASLERNGYTVRALNFSNLNDSNHYNPFQYLQNYEDVMSFVDCLIPSFGDLPLNFITQLEKVICEGLIIYLLHFQPIETRNISCFIDFLESAYKAPENLNDIFNKVRDVEPLFTEQFNLATLEIAIKKETLIRLHARLSKFNTATKELTDNDDIDLWNINKQNTIIYLIGKNIGIPLVPILYSQIIEIWETNMIESEKKAEHEYLFLFIPLPYMDKIPDLARKVSLMRSYKMCCMIFYRNIAEMYYHYSKMETEILHGLCDVTITFANEERTEFNIQ